jgi:hypothetical protein
MCIITRVFEDNFNVRYIEPRGEKGDKVQTAPKEREGAPKDFTESREAKSTAVKPRR